MTTSPTTPRTSTTGLAHSTPNAATPRFEDSAVAAESASGSPWAQRRPALLRVCAGEPLELTADDENLLQLINAAGDLYDVIIDRQMNPDDYRLAEVIAERLCDRHGIDQIAGGARVTGVICDARRYLIPYAVEHAHLAEASRRGISSLLVHDLKPLPRMLAGRLPLPAATVAGDQLGRIALLCLWLNLSDAAQVCHGGHAALQDAVAAGQVPTYADARHGHRLVAPADLRVAGLLIESPAPHGLAKSTANNILSTLELSVDRAIACGATVRGRFQLEAIKPLPSHVKRAAVEKVDYVGLDVLRDTCANVGVVSQAALWLMRLVGLRVGEAYGLQVKDFWRDQDGVPHLDTKAQGGHPMTVRDEETGELRAVDSKEGAKAGSERDVPIVEVLARLLEHLIEIFHTDADGVVRAEARLLPGIGKDDLTGQSTMRKHLKKALGPSAVRFTPHVLRASMLTDLADHGVDERLRFAYAGHQHEHPNIQQEHPNIQQEHYLATPRRVQLRVAVEALTAQCDSTLETSDLRVMTPVRETWGIDTRAYAEAAVIEHQLVSQGWRTAVAGEGSDVELSAVQIADLLGVTERTARRHFTSGDLASHEVAWGSRKVRRAWKSDVDALQERLAQPTIEQVAVQLGLTYHQVWHRLRGLSPTPVNRETTARTRVSHEAVAILKESQSREVELLEHAVPVDMAAQLLDLPVATVGSLLRHGSLVEVRSPHRGRGRYVSRESIKTYNAAFPVGRPSSSESPPAAEALIGFMAAARLMGVSRPTLSAMGVARQVRLASKPGSRHVYVVVESIAAWAEHEGRDDVHRATLRLTARRGDGRSGAFTPALGDHCTACGITGPEGGPERPILPCPN